MLSRLSPRAKRFTGSGIAWIALVLTFSAVYWLMWQARPDAFIVNKEFNFNPFETLHVRLWSLEGSAGWPASSPTRAPAATELDSLMGDVAEIDRAAADLETALVPLRTQQAALEVQSKAAMQIHSDALWANVEKYKTQALAQEKAERAKHEALVAALEHQFGPAPASHQAVVLAEARVDLAHARLREATKAADVGEYVIRNLGAFASSATSARTAQLREELQTNARQQQELGDKLSAVRKRAFDTLDAWLAARRSRLLWIDFVYFSAGVSTSTTFGDIIPNSRPARMAALTQLVLSVFLLGYLVSLTSPSR